MLYMDIVFDMIDVLHTLMPCDNLPDGMYTVQLLPNTHPLGNNGSDKRWMYGRIVGGPLDGTLVSVAMDVPAVSGPTL